MNKKIRLVLTMTMLLALCVGVVACCAMAIGSAVREDDGRTVGYSFMAVVFAILAIKLAGIIESKETTSNSSLKKMSDEADEQIAKLKELENMSKNGKSSLTPKAKETAKRFEAKAFGKALQLDKFGPQIETKISDLCYEAWVAGYFYAKREKEQ
jgi:hypothetical protein